MFVAPTVVIVLLAICIYSGIARRKSLIRGFLSGAFSNKVYEKVRTQ